MRILLVEAEPRLSGYLKKGLEEQVWQVDQAFDGQVGRSLALANSYDVIILDTNLPHINGFDLADQIRREHIQTPILMLTDHSIRDDQLTEKESGADDYLIKPFEFQELVARLRVIQEGQKEGSQQTNMLKVSDLELDLSEKVARRNGHRIKLTAKEFGLLEYLMRNRGRVVSRVDIAEKVWNIHFDTGTNTIDVYVNFLRKKIDKAFPTKLIHTVVGKGYLLKE
jgi:two-component system, OmpR family, copper resistance phosphate regulon response regulator CusR